jgi:hypothetical protein
VEQNLKGHRRPQTAQAGMWEHDGSRPGPRSLSEATFARMLAICLWDLKAKGSFCEISKRLLFPLGWGHSLPQ